jgi:hypothetical protein
MKIPQLEAKQKGTATLTSHTVEVTTSVLVEDKN